MRVSRSSDFVVDADSYRPVVATELAEVVQRRLSIATESPDPKVFSYQPCEAAVWVALWLMPAKYQAPESRSPATGGFCGCCSSPRTLPRVSPAPLVSSTRGGEATRS